MSGVFRTIYHPPPLHPASVSSPRLWGQYTRRAVRGGGSIFRKTSDIGLASYSIIPLRIWSCTAHIRPTRHSGKHRGRKRPLSSLSSLEIFFRMCSAPLSPVQSSPQQWLSVYIKHVCVEVGYVGDYMYVFHSVLYVTRYRTFNLYNCLPTPRQKN